MIQGALRVLLLEGDARDLQPSVVDAYAVLVAESLCPRGIRLVGEDIGRRKRKGALEKAAAPLKGFRLAGQREQGIEAVEVEIHELDVEAIRLPPSDDEVASAAAVRRDRPADHRDVCLERRCQILRQPVLPKPLAELAFRNGAPASGQEHFEDLLRLDSAEV